MSLAWESVSPSLPPSARKVARSAGRRDVDPPHPRCSSVGGDALIAPYAAASPRHQAKGAFRAPARGTFALGGKSTQKRRSNLRFENPCAPSHVFYLVKINHANAVPWKFHLNIALSLLLFSLPLLLWNAGLCASLVHDKIAFQPAARGRHLPLPLRGKGAI